MEHQKILSLLNEASDSKFAARKWNIFNDPSNANYDVGNEIIFNTEVLKSHLCDYNDAYILVKGDITVTEAPATQVSFKNFSPFTKCIAKVDGKILDGAEDLDLVMPMYNLIEYISNYSETTRSLWFNNNIENTDNFKSFKYKTKLLGDTVAEPAPKMLMEL